MIKESKEDDETPLVNDWWKWFQEYGFRQSSIKWALDIKLRLCWNSNRTVKK